MDHGQLEAVARKHGIRLLVQFGSSTTGRVHPRSDVDLGVLLERVPESFDAFSDLVGDLQELIDGREVDVAILNRADPLFLNRVVEQGVLLHGSRRAFQELKIYAYKRYQDHRRFLAMEREFVARRLRAAGR